MANTTIDKPAHGGKRPGAGRKESGITKVKRLFSIDADVANRLQAEPNQSGLVNQLLREHYEPKAKTNKSA